MDQGTGAASEGVAQGADPLAGADPPGGGRVVIERALAAAREELGLEVAYLTEFVDDVQVVRATYGDAEAFGFTEGATVALEGSYCQRVIDGRLPSVVPDTSRNAETRRLTATAEAGLGPPEPRRPGQHSRRRSRDCACCASRTTSPTCG